MIDEETREKEEEKLKVEEEQLRLDFESASFLREALAGSASGPIENKKLGNRSLAAALDHPTASIRENATTRVATTVGAPVSDRYVTVPTWGCTETFIFSSR